MADVLNSSPGLLFKRLLLGFWAMYFTLVAITNTVDLLDTLGAFDWTFLNSGNFDYLRSVVKVYEVGPTLTKLLLGGALVIELTGAFLFWRALLTFGSKPGGRLNAMQAICWGALVWVLFVFNTEFFVAYNSEEPFRELLVIMIASALAITLVPDDGGVKRNAKT